MNNSANNTMMNRDQMIEKIVNKFDELSFNTFYLDTYFLSEYNPWTVHRKCYENLTKYVHDCLADSLYYDSVEFFDYDYENFDDGDRYPWGHGERIVHVDAYSNIRFELNNIQKNLWTFDILDDDNNKIKWFITRPNDLLGNTEWEYFDEVLEFVWRWINDERMIKYNEMRNEIKDYVL